MPRSSESPEKLTRSYRWIIGLLRLVVKAFFRDVVVTGTEHIPTTGGGIVVSWHPNGLIDPGLIITSFPRQIVFGARHGIFRWPLLGRLMRAVGTVPIFRATDLPDMSKADRAKANAKSLSALADAIAGGSFSALFPEGLSHDAPHLKEIKTGAARLFGQARLSTEADQPPPVIIPVGLHYDDKDLFRSNAMVEFHPPIELNPELLVPLSDPQQERARIRAITDEIERVLHDVVLATENWELHRLMHGARTLIRAERGHRAGSKLDKPNVEERVRGFARIRAGYEALVHQHPERVSQLTTRVEDYQRDLQALQIRDHELDSAPRWLSMSLVVLLIIQVLTVYLIAPPLIIVGYLVNTPSALLLWFLARIGSKEKKDEATIKLLVGSLLFPLTWIGAGVLAASIHGYLHRINPTIPDTPILAGIMVALLGAIGGAAAVRYLRVSRETARAVRVRLTRRMQRLALTRLRKERAYLHDALIEMVEGVALPGDVLDDGRVVSVAKAARLNAQAEELAAKSS